MRKKISFQPTRVYQLFAGRVEVFCFGKMGFPFELHHVCQVADDLGVNRILRPQTHTFNAIVCEPEELTRVDHSVAGRIEVRSGVLADGVIIPKGKVALFQTRDCPTIITLNQKTGEVAAAHAGRDSLLDRELILTGDPSRPFKSVVDAIVDRLVGDKPNGHSAYLEVFSCIGIEARRFRHASDEPTYGYFNNRMSRYLVAEYGPDCLLDGNIEIGAIKLHRLIRNQFQRLGVMPDFISNDEREVGTGTQSDFFYSRRNGENHGHNVILVHNRSP